jgi:NAD(P)-dependent dehydrogenase (short-subunit alcohol dehydrogenase family)
MALPPRWRPSVANGMAECLGALEFACGLWRQGTSSCQVTMFVETTEVAGLITFLAGPGGSAINGACIPVDTGTLAG